MLIKWPDCAGDSLMPCSEASWTHCDRCLRLVCRVHDELYEVRHSGIDPNRGGDEMCSTCLQAGVDSGEVVKNTAYEYINLR